ncbi:hypothetical protein SLE2022_290590 [Rubroshorea leprosula]
MWKLNDGLTSVIKRYQTRVTQPPKTLCFTFFLNGRYQDKVSIGFSTNPPRLYPLYTSSLSSRQIVSLQSKRNANKALIFISGLRFIPTKTINFPAFRGFLFD